MKHSLSTLLLMLLMATLAASCNESTQEPLVILCNRYDESACLVDIHSKKTVPITLPRAQERATSPTAPVLAFISATPREGRLNHEEKIGLYNIANEQLEWLAIDSQEWPDGGVRYETIAWSPNGRYLYVYGSYPDLTNLRGPCTLYDCQEKKSVITIPEVMETYWSPDGDKLGLLVLTNYDKLGDPEIEPLTVTRIVDLNGDSYEIPLVLNTNQTVADLFVWTDNQHLALKVYTRYNATTQTESQKIEYGYHYIEVDVQTGEWQVVEKEDCIPDIYPSTLLEKGHLPFGSSPYDLTKSGAHPITEDGYVFYHKKVDEVWSIMMWNPKTHKEELMLRRASSPMLVNGLPGDWLK